MWKSVNWGREIFAGSFGGDSLGNEFGVEKKNKNLHFFFEKRRKKTIEITDRKPSTEFGVNFTANFESGIFFSRCSRGVFVGRVGGRHAFKPCDPDNQPVSGLTGCAGCALCVLGSGPFFSHELIN